MTLADAALARWGLEGASLAPHAEDPTLVFRVDPGPYTLRIESRSRVSDDFVSSQLTWLRALSDESGVTVPEPVPLPRGDDFAVIGDQRCVLLRWIEGESLLVLERTDAAERVGRTMARLHAHAARWEAPAGFTCRTQEVHAPAREALGLSPGEHAFLERARTDVLAARERIARTRSTYGVVHGDLNFRNFVLRDGEACPFDFGEFGRGYFLSDVAEPLRVVTGSPDCREMRAALLAGYRSERSLSLDEEKQLDAFIVGELLASLCWAARPECAPRREPVVACIPTWLETIAELLRVPPPGRAEGSTDGTRPS